MYEHRLEQLLPFRLFVRRFARHALFAGAVILGSLLLGMFGYAQLEDLGWLDAFLNAAMILGGMGPVAPMATRGGKLFAGVYALYSGMVFLVAVGILVAPVMHRVMHRFHLAEDAEADDESDGHSGRRRRARR